MFSILVLCTGNSARSILSESVLNEAGSGALKAYSAGSKPAGAVNPFALALLERKGISTEGARSKSWDEFADGAGGPAFDLVITVCDNAAGETCPIWPGSPMTLHWSFPDPAAAEGSDADKTAAFETVFAEIEPRMKALAAAVKDGLRGDDLRAAADLLNPVQQG